MADPLMPAQVDRARDLAQTLQLPWADTTPASGALLLVVRADRLELREAGAKTGPVWIDFRRMPRAGTKPLIVRAAGVDKGIAHVVDATAGLGRDAFTLALAGCSVTAVERSGVMAALLEDGLRRATNEPHLQDAASRLHLIHGDARAYLAALPDGARPEVVYLDPMFSHRAKSAASKKEMRIGRLVAGEDADADQLLEVARQAATRRVVVKRWLRVPPLAPAPDIVYRGTTIRFDVYLSNSLC